jgi:hypothetical protein
MKADKFTDEPQDDPLQIAGDIALSAIRGALRAKGIGDEDYSVVITLHSGRNAATILHMPDDPSEDEYPMAAFEMQLVHAMLSAKAVGLELRVVGVGQG